jgi:hypothetical protein
MTATYLINRMPSRVIGMKSPCEMLLGENKFLVAPKVFGCTCFVRDHRPLVGKLDPRAVKCIFLLDTHLDRRATSVGVLSSDEHL